MLWFRFSVKLATCWLQVCSSRLYFVLPPSKFMIRFHLNTQRIRAVVWVCVTVLCMCISTPYQAICLYLHINSVHIFVCCALIGDTVVALTWIPGVSLCRECLFLFETQTAGGGAACAGGRVHLCNSSCLLIPSDSHTGVSDGRSASALKEHEDSGHSCRLVCLFIH